MPAASALVGLFLLLVVPPIAAATPKEISISVGSAPGQSTRITLVSKKDSSVIQVGGRVAARLDGFIGNTLTAEAVDIGGHMVGVARVAGQGRVWALVIVRSAGRAHIPWSGELTLRGDPGERLGRGLELRDRDGDGYADIVVGAVDERARLCGRANLPLLRRQALDRKTMRFRPVLLGREQESEAPVLIAGQPPADLPAAPTIDLLVPRSVSSRAGTAPGGAPVPMAPHALSDGDATTGWSEAVGRGGRGEFVTFGWDSSRFPVSGLALRVVAADSPRTFARPKALWLLTETQRFRVEFPVDPAEAPGAAAFVALPTPIATRCMSLVVDAHYPGEDPDAPVALYEVTGYSTLDSGVGLAGLVDEMRLGGSDAARLLADAGPAGRDAVIAAWPKLEQQGQVLAISVLARHAREHVPAMEVLSRANRSEHPQVRERALAALANLGDAGFARLALEIPGPAAEASALALARAGRREVVMPVLNALSGAPAPEHSQLRRALAIALQRNPEAGTEVARWLADSPAVGAAANAALALAGLPDNHSLVTRIIADYRDRASAFEDRYRLVRACAKLPSDPETDAWLAKLAGGAQQWMLREAALDALDGRDSPVLAGSAEAGLLDQEPRIRARAVRALARRGLAQDRVLKHLRQDVWFLVRVAAVESAPDSQAARAAIRERVRDRLGVVREAAITRLTRLSDRDAWPLVKARLASDKEYRSVLLRAIEYSRALCVRQGAPMLRDLVQRGLSPGSLESDKEVAIEALSALAALGGDDAQEMLAVLSRGDLSSGLRRAAEQAAKLQPGCSPSP